MFGKRPLYGTKMSKKGPTQIKINGKAAFSWVSGTMLDPCPVPLHIRILKNKMIRNRGEAGITKTLSSFADAHKQFGVVGTKTLPQPNGNFGLGRIF